MIYLLSMILFINILGNLSQVQRVATLGVSSKINAYLDDVDGKVYEDDHSGRVLVLGVGICPT